MRVINPSFSVDKFSFIDKQVGNFSCGIQHAAWIVTQIKHEAFQTGLGSDSRVQAILTDLSYGRAVRRLAIASASYGFLDGVIDLAGREPLLRRALFNCVSAHQPYREIAWATLRPALTLRLGRIVIGSLLGLTWWSDTGSGYREIRT